MQSTANPRTRREPDTQAVQRAPPLPGGERSTCERSFSERSKSGEGEPLYRESFPPHPNPLPAGERERAEFSATSVSQSSPATASGNAFPRGGEAYPSGERGDVPIEPVTSPAR